MTEAAQQSRPLIRVLCVDDRPDITTILRMIIGAEPDMECVGVLHSSNHLLKHVRALQPPPAPSNRLVIVLDASMPGRDPMLTMRELADAHPEVKTIIFSGSGLDAAFIDRAMDHGACGMVAKRDPPERLIECIREAAAGRTSFPSAKTSAAAFNR